MIKLVYRCTRPSLEIKWYQKSSEVQELAENARKEKRLLNEEFYLDDNGLTLFISHIWADKQSYSDYVNSPEMLEWRLGRSAYNSNNNITFELYSTLED
jgi:quinol monooxygenase YgiN